MTVNKRAIKSDLTKVDKHRIKPEEYDDAPELTDAQLAGAVVTAARPVGRPRLAQPKQAVKIRLDAEVISHFKAGGDGWQTRINDVLLRTARRDSESGQAFSGAPKKQSGSIRDTQVIRHSSDGRIRQKDLVRDPGPTETPRHRNSAKK